VTSPLEPGATGNTTTATWWEAEGRRIAGELGDVSAVLILATNHDCAARVALGIARVVSDTRHVALGDLTGDAAPLYAVAGGEDAFGLSDCLRQGLPLNDIARPAPDRESLFILPAGSPPVACEEILGHERWPRLVSGFAKVGALLLLVAPIDAAGVNTLAAAVSGVVLVDVPALRARNFHVLATVSAPVDTLAVARAEAKRQRRTRAAVALIAILAIAGAGWAGRNRILTAYHAALAKRAAPAAVGAAPGAAAAPAGTPPAGAPAAPAEPADTVRLIDPVNPADTSTTAQFAVEVMAANTLAGANSFLSDNAKEMSRNGATISPVGVGGSTNVWYKVVVGASHDRAGADSLLAALRRGKLVRSGEGLVVKVPYALVLAENVAQAGAEDLRKTWQQRGFSPYFLMQNDGSVRLLAGAFETAAQAASLASALRAAGVAPVLAFRTGRTY
jgi:hypothetical protein